MTAKWTGYLHGRFVFPMRLVGYTRQDLEAIDAGVSTAKLAEAGIEAFLGYARCGRCDTAIPFRYGDLRGEPPVRYVPGARDQALRQKCHSHEPVLIGYETASGSPSQSGTAQDAATTEGDAGVRTEPPAPVPAKARKAPRQRGPGSQHVFLKGGPFADDPDYPEETRLVAAESTPAATAARLAAEVPGVGLASELPSPRPGTLAFKPPVDEPHLPPVHEVPVVPQRAKQGLTTSHAVTCKCGICKPAKGSKR